MAGIRVVHTSARNTVYLVPILSKPFTGDSLPRTDADKCPSCHLFHMVKTVHLWLDGAGTCIVSEGVLADLQSAGMPDLMVEATIEKPPALNFGGGVTRPQIDNGNRKLVRWAPIHQ